MEITVGSYVKVNVSFEGSEEGDLTVYPNDIVKINAIVDDEWLNGSIGDFSGIFPKSFCSLLTFQPQHEPYGVALFDHDAHLHDELSFHAGDQILNLKCINNEWYEGTCKGQNGIFPSNFISIVKPILRKRQSAKPQRPASLSEDTLTVLRERSGSAGRRKSSPRLQPEATSLSCKSAPHIPDTFEPPPRKSHGSFQKPMVPPHFDPPPPSADPARTKPEVPPRVELGELCSDPRDTPNESDPPFVERPSTPNQVKPIVQRPPTLDPGTLSLLRSRAGSQHKARKSESSTEVVDVTEEAHGLEESVELDDADQHSTPPWSSAFPDNFQSLPASVETTSKSDSLADSIPQPELYNEEVEYANEADIQSVKQEYETTKLEKKIAALDKELSDLNKSKSETEQLLAQQFSGKKVNQESVALLQSILKEQREKINELMKKLDRLQVQARKSKSPDGSTMAKGIEKRDKVVVELISTEEMNVKHLQLCVSGFIEPLRNNPCHKMDIDKLFLNMENILSLSSKLLMMLKGQETLMSHEQLIGRCFTHLEDELHAEYSFYLENHMHVVGLVEEYTADKTNAGLLEECLVGIRDETTCWDLHTFLIRPVQRVMKYPLLLKEMLAETPAHWPDRPFITNALQICDNIVTYANENKRKEELLRRYNLFDAGSLLPRISLHGMKKKSKRFTTSVTHTLNITNSIAADKEFQDLTEQFTMIHTITKNLIQEAMSFTGLIREIQEHMQALCKSIHDFYDDLSTQRDVFLYHAAALKIADSLTPRFIEDLEGGPIQTLTELLKCFERPLLLVEKRNSKVLDYDNVIANCDSPDGSPNENMKIARGEFEALHEQLVEDLPIIIRESSQVVEKSAYSVLALYCQYSHLCYDELKGGLDKMSLGISDIPESIPEYHSQRMEESCRILLDICSFDSEVTHAIVRGGGTIKRNEVSDTSEVVSEERLRHSDHNVAMWLTDDDLPETPQQETVVEIPSPSRHHEDQEEERQAEVGSESDEDTSEYTIKEENPSPTYQERVVAAGSVSITNEDDIPDLMGTAVAGTECMVMFDFTGTTDGTINVGEGTKVVLASDCKQDDSWCYIEVTNTQRGYVPKSFLVKVEDCGFSPAPQRSETLSRSKRKAPPPPSRKISSPPVQDTYSKGPSEKDPKKAPLAPKRSAPVPVQKSPSSEPELKVQPRRGSYAPKRAAPAPPKLKKSVTVSSIPSPVTNSPAIPTSPSSQVELRSSITQQADLLLNLSNCEFSDDPPDPADKNSISSQSSFLTADEELGEASPNRAMSPPITLILEEAKEDVETPAPASSPPPPAVAPAPPPEPILPDTDVSLRLSTFVMDNEDHLHLDLDKSAGEGVKEESRNDGDVSVSSASAEDTPRPDLAPDKTTDVELCSNLPEEEDFTHTDTSPALSSGYGSQIQSPVVTKPGGKPTVPSSPLPKAPAKSTPGKRVTNTPRRPGPSGFDLCPEEFTHKECSGPQQYKALYNYAGRSFRELSLTSNQIVEVLDTVNADWWWIRVGRREGYVPSEYLQRL